MRRVACVSSGKTWTRLSSTFSKLGGRLGLALRSRTAPNSSSAKNALPPERRKICSTSSAAGLPPRFPCSSCAIVTIEAIDIQPVNSLAAVQFGEEGTDRMAAVQVVGAVGQHEEQCRSQIADQKGEQVQSRAVGPMQVLDHQHSRGTFRQTIQQAEKSLEQPGLRRRADHRRARRRLRYVVGRPELRQHAGQSDGGG